MFTTAWVAIACLASGCGTSRMSVSDSKPSAPLHSAQAAAVVAARLLTAVPLPQMPTHAGSTAPPHRRIRSSGKLTKSGRSVRAGPAGSPDPALVPSDELRLDEQDEGIGPNAVVGHRVGTSLGLHHSLRGGHVGNVGKHRPRFGFAGSRKVRTVMPRGPNISSRFGDASQCALSLTSWYPITSVIAVSPLVRSARCALGLCGDHVGVTFA